MYHQYFQTAMYLRLSRDDMKNGLEKKESNSIGNQRELLKAFLQEQPDMELYDIYIDDGYSGSNFDRPEFQRMFHDIEAGKVNCVLVKDLSRFGRDYIETGRYLQKIFPAFSVRFIAVTDHYDSFRADAGESNIVLPVKNFINDSYCRDISMKVKSQFAVKRKNGEYIAPFALYGYQKAENNKNRLLVDAYAAQVVRKIFEWKIEGAAVSAIAEKLNGLGVLSPKEYKKFSGVNYQGGFPGAAKARWSSASVKRILTNEMYLGHMVQGKTEKINYKVKKSIEKPEREWIRVENTHEPIISEDAFRIVQNLLKSDSRANTSSEKIGFFTGLLFCGDCKEQMIRRVNRYQNTERVYYICSTKNRGEGCTRHSIREDALKEMVFETVRKYGNCFQEGRRIHGKAVGLEVNADAMNHYREDTNRLKETKEKYEFLCSGLYEDFKQGVITKEEYERLYREFRGKTAELEQALKKQEAMYRELSRKAAAAAERVKTLQSCMELKEIDRHTLCSMVRRIWVFERKRVEVEFEWRLP